MEHERVFRRRAELEDLKKMINNKLEDIKEEIKDLNHKIIKIYEKTGVEKISIAGRTIAPTLVLTAKVVPGLCSELKGTDFEHLVAPNVNRTELRHEILLRINELKEQGIYSGDPYEVIPMELRSIIEIEEIVQIRAPKSKTGKVINCD